MNGAVKRRTAWDDEVVGVDVVSAGNSDQELLASVTDIDKRGCTIVRVLAHLWMTPAAGTVVNGTQRLWFGLQLVSEEARTAGVLPDPDQQTDYPILGWMYRDVFVVTSNSTQEFRVAPTELRVDLRSQRKIDRAAIVMSIRNRAGSGTSFTVSVQGVVRTLYKLA